MSDLNLNSESTPSGSTASKFSNSLLEYCTKNPFFALWNIALIFGGLITLVHFVKTGYFPDLDIKTSASFILGIALVGLLLVLMLSFMLVIPSYLIRSNVWSPYCLHKEPVAGTDAERVSKEISEKRQLPFACLSVLYGFIAFFIWIFIFSFTLSESNAEYGSKVRHITGGGFIVFVILLFLLRYIGVRRTKRQGVAAENIFGHGYAAQHFHLFIIWIMVYFGYLFLFVLAATKLRQNDVVEHAALIAFAFMLAFANTSLAIIRLDNTKSYLVFPFIALILIFVYLNIPTNTFSLTRSVFASLGIGNIGSTKFVVKISTCDAVNLIVPRSCKVVSEATGCIRPQSLENRIGNDYLLSLKIPDARNVADDRRGDVSSPREAKIPIPKSEVLAWGMVPATNQPDNDCGMLVETGIQ